jgi:hypothetical protein
VEPGNDLDRLAALYGSDKFGGHCYTPIYHQYFSGYRNNPVELLEIGIGGYSDPSAGGSSLRMWNDYFPNGTIFGLDYFHKTSDFSERVHIFQGSQVDPRVISRILNETREQSFDIIIDDGSHRGEHVVQSFLMLFQFVKPGGWYVVEDTETSFWPDYGGASADANQRLTTFSFFKQCIDNLHWRERDLNWRSGGHHGDYSPNFLDEAISTIHFHYNLIFVKRAA